MEPAFAGVAAVVAHDLQGQTPFPDSNNACEVSLLQAATNSPKTRSHNRVPRQWEGARPLALSQTSFFGRPCPRAASKQALAFVRRSACAEGSEAAAEPVAPSTPTEQQHAGNGTSHAARPLSPGQLSSNGNGDTDVYGLSKTARHQFMVDMFRQASPYVNVHRGSTFVIYFSGEAIRDVSFFRSLVADFAMLNSLGCHLVLVAGARPQIEERLIARGLPLNTDDNSNVRITDKDTLSAVKDAVGSVRVDIEASLSVNLVHSPLAGADIHVASGNFVMAKPMGVRDGLDYQFSGEVRRVEVDAIKRRLDNGEIVLLSPLGYSVTGEVFNCNSEEVAFHAAQALGADKLIYLTEKPTDTGTLTRSEAQEFLESHYESMTPEVRRALARGVPKGVRRMHMVHRKFDGSLLIELFTRDGIGTMVLDDLYEGIRSARMSDIAAIESLIRPLEAKGILVHRSREQLRADVINFVVAEREDRIIGCAALYPWRAEGLAEVACMAVHPQFRDGGKGDNLLGYLERKAFNMGIRCIFCLSTQSSHWFLERGFEQVADFSKLPEKRQAKIDHTRNSKLYIKTLLERGVEAGELFRHAKEKEK